METSSHSAMQPKFSEGADESQLMTETETLLEGEWKLDEEQMGVEKTYYFKTYTKALVTWFPRPSYLLLRLYRTFFKP